MSFCCLPGLCKDPVQLEGRARWYEPLNKSLLCQEVGGVNNTDVLARVMYAHLGARNAKES